jgi:hypothetical protein
LQIYTYHSESQNKVDEGGAGADDQGHTEESTKPSSSPHPPQLSRLKLSKHYQYLYTHHRIDWRIRNYVCDLAIYLREKGRYLLLRNLNRIKRGMYRLMLGSVRVELGRLWYVSGNELGV